MGKPDIVIVFNNGEVTFFASGANYVDREGAIKSGLIKWNFYVKEMMSMADNPEELIFEIKSINIYEIYEEEE